ncbi:hypothetical protein ACJX0J_015789, partial [Zea mays]
RLTSKAQHIFTDLDILHHVIMEYKYRHIKYLDIPTVYVYISHETHVLIIHLKTTSANGTTMAKEKFSTKSGAVNIEIGASDFRVDGAQHPIVKAQRAIKFAMGLEFDVLIVIGWILHQLDKTTKETKSLSTSNGILFTHERLDIVQEDIEIYQIIEDCIEAIALFFPWFTVKRHHAILIL